MKVPYCALCGSIQGVAAPFLAAVQLGAVAKRVDSKDQGSTDLLLLLASLTR